MLGGRGTRSHEVAYYAKHTWLRGQCLVGHWLLATLDGRREAPPEGAALEALRARYQELLARDVANARAGLYPSKALFSMPLSAYARAMPRFVADLPRVMARRRSGRFRDLPETAAAKRYPAYFRRNYHWQTDGYLSEHSADLYDLGVEFLFMGTADVMRRQILPPIVEFVRTEGDRCERLLDVGCGTGRSLSLTALACPALRLYGVDLSPYYAAAARRAVRGLDATILADNAESLPFRDGFFDIVTNVFVFHELPRRARRTVLREMYRVLRPGGLMVVQDAAQRLEGEAVLPFLERFPSAFHEPFFADYLEDDLGEACAALGLQNVEVTPTFVAKVVSGRRPA